MTTLSWLGTDTHPPLSTLVLLAVIQKVLKNNILFKVVLA
jgi:hypothetical protein